MWAVVVSENVAKTGLADLLFAELATIRDIKLVERERLKDVSKELELYAFHNTETIQKRLALGQELSADRLLIITADDQETRSTGNAIVLDTVSGAQLGQVRVCLQDDRIESESRYLTGWAGQIQEQYRDGVQAVVGVPFFISKSFGRRFELLQRDYARILTNALAQTPSVAVVSIEESRLIERELALRGETMAPVIPLFVEGEYSIVADGPDPVCQVTLKVVISDRKESLAVIERSDIPYNDVPQFLTTDVANRVVELAVGGDAKPLAPREVEEKLIHAADRLAGMACFNESAALRDTVVLIDPSNVDERIKCLTDYLAGGGTDVVYVFQRFDYLMRNRLINFCQAARFLDKARSFDFSGVKRSGEGTVPLQIVDDYAFCRYYLAELCKLPAPTCDAETVFAVNPVGDVKSFTDQERIDQKYAICWALVSQFHSPIHSGFGWDGYRCYLVDDICKLFRDLPPEYLMWYQAKDLKAAAEAWQTREKRVLGERFEASGDMRLKLLAGYLLLGMKVMAHPEEICPADREEIQKLSGILKNLRSREDSPVIPRAADAFERNLQEVAKAIERQLAEHREPYERIVNPITERPEPPEDASAELAIEVIDDWKPPAEPLHASFSVSSGFARFGRGPSRQRHIRLEKHQEGVDIAWDEVSVRLLTATGGRPAMSAPFFTAKEFPGTNNSDFVFKVRSDGTYIWIATVDRGILTFTTEGALVAHFDAEMGLPGYLTPLDKTVQRWSDKGSEIYPHGQRWPNALGFTSWGSDWQELIDYLGSPPKTINTSSPVSFVSLTIVPVGCGQCLAIGRVDANRRLWIAVLRISGSDGQPSVEVIHTAPRVLPVEEYEAAKFVGAPNLIDVAFTVPWTCIYQSPQDENDRVCIVGRWHEGYQCYLIYNTPLAIDLNTWRVTPLAERLPQFAEVVGGTAAQCLDGSLIVQRDNRLLAYLPKEGGTAECRVLSDEVPTQNHYLVRYKNSVISPGQQWYRVSPHPERSVEAKVIAGETLPRQHELNYYSESAVYGLYASNYDGDVSYQIHPGPQDPGKVSAFARYVPRTKLPKHDGAVSAIRKLGGFVDRTDRCPLIEFSQDDAWRTAPAWVREGMNIRPCRHTIVCLTEAWKGGDAGLRHLLDLYAVSAVYVLGAPISDEAMKYIEKLDELEELYLVGTGVTNEGLAATIGNRTLRRLHLENGSKDLLGDAVLEFLPADSQLEYLGIQGHTFTTACIPQLATVRTLKILRLLETSIPTAAHNEIAETYRQATGRPLEILDD